MAKHAKSRLNFGYLMAKHVKSIFRMTPKRNLVSCFQIFHNGINAKCSINQSSDVSCSNEMYANPRLWRVSKNKVQKQIRKLLIKLSQLKVS